jgi:hypothetical protein
MLPPIKKAAPDTAKTLIKGWVMGAAKRADNDYGSS